MMKAEELALLKKEVVALERIADALEFLVENAKAAGKQAKTREEIYT